MVFDSMSAAREYEQREKMFRPNPKVPLTCVVGGWDVEDRRLCGYRAIGGRYLASSGDLVELANVFNSEGVVSRGPIMMFPRPVNAGVQLSGYGYVGYSYVSRETILGDVCR
jgi:hypothetical protein